MKIMRRDSWFGGCAVAAAARSMRLPVVPAGNPFLEEQPMTWQTPAATDLRFGFEITMYVTAR
jgi:coenzyme PQQ precursor peptide PqqA